MMRVSEWTDWGLEPPFLCAKFRADTGIFGTWTNSIVVVIDFSPLSSNVYVASILEFLELFVVFSGNSIWFFVWLFVIVCPEILVLVSSNVTFVIFNSLTSLLIYTFVPESDR